MRTNYQRMSVSELLTECGDDPGRWAAAFQQTMPKDPSLDELTEFLGDVIEHSADVRRARAAECGPQEKRWPPRCPTCGAIDAMAVLGDQTKVVKAPEIDVRDIGVPHLSEED